MVFRRVVILFLLIFLSLSQGIGIVLGADKKASFPSQLKDLKVEKVRISLGGDIRLRYEYRENFDFNAIKDDRDGLWYMRTRLNIEVTFNKNFSTFFEGLDGREWSSDKSPKAQEDNFDFHQGYIKITKPWNIPLNLTLGRQKLQYGAKRLVAAPIWSNKTRSFDAIKLNYNPENISFDLFGGNVVRYQDNRFNPPSWRNNFFGAYFTYKGIKEQVFDLYSLNLIDDKRKVKGEDGKYGNLKRYTIGTRGEGKINETSLGYGYEFAYQSGDKGSDDIKAFAYHLDLNYLFKDIKWKPGVKIEYNFASGDNNPKDGKAKTFDPLFQTVHDPYGIIDFFRWQNMKEIALIMGLKPIKDFDCSIEYHRFYLPESKDAWYDSSGKKIREDKSGNASDYVGDEFDMVLKYKLNKFLEIESGYSHFFTGDYIKDTGPSADADWVYFQTVFKF